MPVRRDYFIVAGIAAVIGLILMFSLTQPAYTDAYYYFNAGQRLATGQGLTDAALWTYLGNPATLPAPSHLYWMPLASLVQAVSMFLFGATFHAAQLPMLLCYVGLVLLAFWLGGKLHGSRRGAWLAAILTLFSGYFMAYWLMTDAFALFGVVGAGALICIGMGQTNVTLDPALKHRARLNLSAPDLSLAPGFSRGDSPQTWRWFVAAGALSALAHLTRADGLLFILVLVVMALLRRNPKAAVLGVLAYVLVMSAWFVRNYTAVGSILPVGGFQTVWMRDYADTVNYPGIISLEKFLNSGFGFIAQSRWEAVFGSSGALANLIAVEGMIVLAPLMLVGLWKRRFDPFLSAFILYAAGLHVAMSLVFALPGMRGGLFHSAAALVPFWAALGVCGLDDVIRWLAKRRRWKVQGALRFFSVALVVLVIGFSLMIVIPTVRRFNVPNTHYIELDANLPKDAVVIINDPSAFYYYTGHMGIVVPNAPSEVIPELAAKYGATHLILDENRTEPMNDLYAGKNIPPFLKLISSADDLKIYEVIR
jgi:4-amino-4-deoxy-L-arabinose transferase-like glycosyltransferase